MKYFVLLALAGGLAHANNPHIDQGEAGYVTWAPYFIGSGGYEDVVIGPMDFSRNYFKHWKVEHIRITSQTYTELFDIVDKNQIRIHFEVSFQMAPVADQSHIRQLVERYGGARWYESVAKQPLRSFVRDSIGEQDSGTLSTSQELIQQKVADRAHEWLRQSQLPLLLEKVSVGNFQFPEAISNAAAEKQASLQRLQAKSTLLEIARKDADIEVARADGIKRAQEVINQTLTPIYVKHEMVEALKEISQHPGNVIIYVPTGPDGIPIVQQLPNKPN